MANPGSDIATVAVRFFESARSVHVFSLARDGRVHDCNAAVCDNLGHAREAIVGRPIFEFLTEPDARTLAGELEAPAPRTATLRLNFSGTDHIPYTLEAWLQVDTDAAVLVAEPPLKQDQRLQREMMKVTQSLAVASRDRVRLAERERRSRLDAERANRQKDEVVGIVAHELRQPLGAVRYALELMKPEVDPATRGRAMAVIARQVTRLTRQVEDLLDVSRLRLGRLTLRLEKTDLCAIVRDAADAFRPRYNDNGLALEAQIPADDVCVNADRDRLGQVLSNLLENAAKFTDRGGQVTLALTADADWATLSIRDTGRGIAPDLLPQLFQLFRQGSEGERGGLGIGLAVAHALVESHGGTIEARSAGLGQGTEFVIRLPVVVAGAPAI